MKKELFVKSLSAMSLRFSDDSCLIFDVSFPSTLCGEKTLFLCCIEVKLIMCDWQSERLHKVLEYVNIVHELCSVLGKEFFQIINDVHPSLDDSRGQPKSVSNETLDLLAKTIHTLQAEKKKRMSTVRLLVPSHVIEHL